LHHSTPVPLRQSPRGDVTKLQKQRIDPPLIFSYNPTMFENYFPSYGGFYLPDHDPPLWYDFRLCLSSRFVFSEGEK
jgi:hypothetical protein